MKERKLLSHIIGLSYEGGCEKKQKGKRNDGQEKNRMAGRTPLRRKEGPSRAVAADVNSKSPWKRSGGKKKHTINL